MVNAQLEIDRFWERHPGLDKSQPVWVEGEHICTDCCKTFKRAQDLKGHHTKGKCQWKTASRVGTRAWKAARRARKVAAQQRVGTVRLREEQLENVHDMVYLGVDISADGDTSRAMESRMMKADVVYRSLRHVWHSKILSTRLKLDIYTSAVVSVARYGCECWDFGESARKRLGAWNCRKLVSISGFSFKEEYAAPEVDLVGMVRAQRLEWAGHLLRAEESYLPRRVAVAELERFQSIGRPGGLFMDMPEFQKHTDIDGLVQIALNRERWRWWVQRFHREWGEKLIRKHSIEKWKKDLDI